MCRRGGGMNTTLGSTHYLGIPATVTFSKSMARPRPAKRYPSVSHSPEKVRPRRRRSRVVLNLMTTAGALETSEVYRCRRRDSIYKVIRSLGAAYTAFLPPDPKLPVLSQRRMRLIIFTNCWRFGRGDGGGSGVHYLQPPLVLRLPGKY